MKKVACVICVFLLVACGKKPPEASSRNSPSPAAAGETDSAKTLETLTQAVRKYAAEMRAAPKSIDDVVAAGYLAQMPEAPAGKKFVIDDNLRVQLQ
jgi:hypothetical protein